MTNTEFYFMYVITGTLSFGVAVWVYFTTWPSTDPENRSKYFESLGEFWKDENGEYPIFIASKLVIFCSILKCLNFKTNPLMYGTVIYAMALVFSTYGSIAFFCIKTVRHLNANKLSMTERTRQLQKHLTITLLAQV